MDPAVRQWCLSKENCRRRSMLRAIGSTEVLNPSTVCCDVCNFFAPTPELRFEAMAENVISRAKRRRTVVNHKDFEEQLKNDLRQEREAYMNEHPAFRMLGAEFVCSDSVIDRISSQAHYIKTEGDLGDQFCIRQELKSKFLHIILCALKDVSVSKRYKM